MNNQQQPHRAYGRNISGDVFWGNKLKLLKIELRAHNKSLKPNILNKLIKSYFNNYKENHTITSKNLDVIRRKIILGIDYYTPEQIGKMLNTGSSYEFTPIPIPPTQRKQPSTLYTLPPRTARKNHVTLTVFPTPP